MSDVTRILTRLESGDSAAAEELLPLVYDELRKLAAAKLADEQPGQTLQATALVHEAYLRLVGDRSPQWDSRGHFFAAAAESMRRILVEAARRKKRYKRGGDWSRRELVDVPAAEVEPREDVVALDEALHRLAAKEPEAAKLVQLRYFAGLTIVEAAQILDVPLRTAERRWAYARAWLHRELTGRDPPGN